MPVADKFNGDEGALDCAHAPGRSRKTAHVEHTSQESSISARQSPARLLDDDRDSSPMRSVNLMDETSGSEADSERESDSPSPDRGYDANFSTGKYMRFNRRWGISRHYPSPNATIPAKRSERQPSFSDDEEMEEISEPHDSIESHEPDKDLLPKGKCEEDAQENEVRPKKRAKKQQRQLSQRPRTK